VAHGLSEPGGQPEETSRGWRPGPFAALRHRNFRLFFVGQLISLIGTWMQRIAQAWLVLQVTNSPFLLGLVGALQWLPVLVLSLIGGVNADSVNKRALLVLTQTVQMLLAFVLGILVLTSAVQFWHIAVLAVALGVTAAFDIPARQAFIFEMVEGVDMMNAVALNSTIFNAARLLGPAVAGIAVGTVGMAWAFLANGVSFLPVIAALLLMRVRRAPTAVDVSTGLVAHLREGLAYLGQTPAAVQVITLVAAQSIFVMNYTVLVPVLARDVLHQDAAGFGFLMSAQGAGALVGGLGVASVSTLGPRPIFLFGGATVLALANLLLAGARNFALAAAVLGLAGVSLVLFTATANTALQVTTPDHLRGRVMAMYAIVMGGMTPVGSLVQGFLAEVWGAPGALAVGGVAGLAAVGAVLRWRAAGKRAHAPSTRRPSAAGDWRAAGGDGGGEDLR